MMDDQQHESSRKVFWLQLEEFRKDDDEDCTVTSTKSIVSCITLDTAFDDSIRSSHHRSSSLHPSSSVQFPTASPLVLLDEEEGNDRLTPVPQMKMPSYSLHTTLYNGNNIMPGSLEVSKSEPRSPCRPEVNDMDSSCQFESSFVSPLPAKKPLKSLPPSKAMMDDLDSSFKFKACKVSPLSAEKPVRQVSGGRAIQRSSGERQNRLLDTSDSFFKFKACNVSPLPAAKPVRQVSGGRVCLQRSSGERQQRLLDMLNAPGSSN